LTTYGSETPLEATKVLEEISKPCLRFAAGESSGLSFRMLPSKSYAVSEGQVSSQGLPHVKIG
jgi:hypothetical protein